MIKWQFAGNFVIVFSIITTRLPAENIVLCPLDFDFSVFTFIISQLFTSAADPPPTISTTGTTAVTWSVPAHGGRTIVLSLSLTVNMFTSLLVSGLVSAVSAQYAGCPEPYGLQVYPHEQYCDKFYKCANGEQHLY